MGRSKTLPAVICLLILSASVLAVPRDPLLQIDNGNEILFPSFSFSLYDSWRCWHAHQLGFVDLDQPAQRRSCAHVYCVDLAERPLHRELLWRFQTSSATRTS